MKIIRAHGGKAELHCLYGDGWHWRVKARREDVPIHRQRKNGLGFTFTNVDLAGMGYAHTLRDARRMAISCLTPFDKKPVSKKEEPGRENSEDHRLFGFERDH